MRACLGLTRPDIDLVRNQVRAIEVKLPGRFEQSYSASIVREVPTANEQLPSKALSVAGGGQATADPRDDDRFEIASALVSSLISNFDRAPDVRIRQSQPTFASEQQLGSRFGPSGPRGEFLVSSSSHASMPEFDFRPRSGAPERGNCRSLPSTATRAFTDPRFGLVQRMAPIWTKTS